MPGTLILNGEVVVVELRPGDGPGSGDSPSTTSHDGALDGEVVAGIAFLHAVMNLVRPFWPFSCSLAACCSKAKVTSLTASPRSTAKL